MEGRTSRGLAGLVRNWDLCSWVLRVAESYSCWADDGYGRGGDECQNHRA